MRVVALSAGKLWGMRRLADTAVREHRQARVLAGDGPAFAEQYPSV